jgi:Uma2 family endonuclease
MIAKHPATVEDLYRVPDGGKAEIVNGELVLMSPTGIKPGRAGGKIYASLQVFEDEHGGGCAIPDNVGFLVDLPGRTSFSPDAGWYVGDADDMHFARGAPAFAVKVRSEGDYGPTAERAIAAKIEDYFAAGTQVVWDVDLLSDDVIRVHRAANRDAIDVFRRGEAADAEPAVPGWRFPVDRLLKRPGAGELEESDER